MASASLLFSSSPSTAALRSTRHGHTSASLARVDGPVSVSRREGIAGALVSIVALAPPLLLVRPAAAAILEADDDEELLEKVKKDRQRRIERQVVIRSSDKETVMVRTGTSEALLSPDADGKDTQAAGYLQDVVYKLSKVGQAIEKNDLSAVTSVLGPSVSASWIENLNAAFSKLTSSPEGQTEVDTFNSSLVTLISSVGKNDVESTKVAFVSSAGALERWVELSGLIGQLKGL